MKINQLFNLRRFKQGGLLASLAIVFTCSGDVFAQNNIVALGRVSGAGVLVSGTSSVGALIVPVRNSAGDYTVTITAAGAFTGADANDFAVQAAVAATTSGDDMLRVNLSAVTANTITLEVQVDDLENNPSGGLSADGDFFFTLFRIPTTAVADNTTPYLLASGKVNAAGGVVSSIGRNGVTTSSSLNAAGDYTITLANPGGFVGDTSNDYVLALTLEGSGAAGYAVRGDVSSVASDGSIALNVHTDDVQAAVDATDAVAASRAFFFTVFKTTVMPLGTLDTTTLTTNARVDATGTLLSSTNSFDGGTVSSVRQATGYYRVTITSTGAFTSRSAADFIAHATLNQGSADDDGIMTEVVLADANTLRIDVSVTDVEQSGQSEGLATDAGFYLTVLDAVADPDPVARYQPDLRIGRRSSTTRMVGNNTYNRTGRDQNIDLTLEKQKWSTYYFALQNDGNVMDRIRIRELRHRSTLRTKFFRLSDGRKNVTGRFTRAGVLEESVIPGQIIRYQGRVKYGSPVSRPEKSLRIRARSLNDFNKIDAVRVDVKSHRSRDEDAGQDGI